jgi:hypothetical protein
MMKKYLFAFFIFHVVNIYAQDSTKSHGTPFPKNNFKINMLSPIVHTVTASYERMITRKCGIEYCYVND